MGRPARYPTEFRREAIALVKYSGRPVAEVARSLEIAEDMLWNWVNLEREATERSADPDALTESERAGLKRLRKKKGVGHLAAAPKPSRNRLFPYTAAWERSMVDDARRAEYVPWTEVCDMSSAAVVEMVDGFILVWSEDSGAWSLVPTIQHVPWLVAMRGGVWKSIKSGHTLTRMSDGRILDWEPATGTWRLWNYSPFTVNILSGHPVAHGTWISIRAGHELVVMKDGLILDWVPATGEWRLWPYDPTNAQDILPGDPLASGRWASITRGHSLRAMPDGRVLDWQPKSGDWRLWNYDPENTGDVLPGEPFGTGHWATIHTGHEVIPLNAVSAGWCILDWVPTTSKYRIFQYDPHPTGNILHTDHIVEGHLATPTPSASCRFDVNPIVFSDGVPVGGNVSLVIRNDGTYTYSGHFHDSSVLVSFQVSNAIVVVDAQGRAYTFATDGKVGSENLDWKIEDTNEDIAKNWSDLASAHSWRQSSTVGLDGLGTLTALVKAIQEAYEVTVKVIPVVGPVLGLL